MAKDAKIEIKTDLLEGEIKVTRRIGATIYFQYLSTGERGSMVLPSARQAKSIRMFHRQGDRIVYNRKPGDKSQVMPLVFQKNDRTPPVPVSEWLLSAFQVRERGDVKRYLKKGKLTIESLEMMLEDFALYRMNYEAEKNDLQPPMIVM